MVKVIQNMSLSIGHINGEARTQDFSLGGDKFVRCANPGIFLPPPLALKMLLFYIKSTITLSSPKYVSVVPLWSQFKDYILLF